MLDHRQRRGAAPGAVRLRTGGRGQIPRPRRRRSARVRQPVPAVRRAADARLPARRADRSCRRSSRPGRLREAAPKRRSRPSRYSKSGAASATIAPFSTSSSIVNGTSASTMPSSASSPTEAISASSSNFCSACAAASSSGMAASGRDDVGDRRQRRRRRVLAQRGRDQIDAQRRFVGGGAAGQLDPAEPAIRQFADDAPASSNRAISAAADRVPIRVTRSRALYGTRPNGADDAHPPKAPGQKARRRRGPGMPACRSAISASKPCNAPSSSAGWMMYGVERSRR